MAGDKPLLQIEGKVLRSTATNVAIAGPLVVLVNRETTAAAETLAAILRKANAAMIIGAATPGQAGVFMEYPLKNGQRLRLASGMVRLGDGTALTGAGLKPDVSVEVKPDDERAYLADPFTDLNPAAPPKPGTTTAARRRMNEAELVRRQREGRTRRKMNLSARAGTRTGKSCGIRRSHGRSIFSKGSFCSRRRARIDFAVDDCQSASHFRPRLTLE